MIFIGGYEGPLLFLGIALAFLVTQTSKALIQKPKNFFDLFWHTGGGPSSHVAPLVAMLVMTFGFEGFSPFFVLVFALTAIVLRDAVGVRFAEGMNAQVLKEIVPKKFKKQVIVARGHTPQDVAWGVAIGFAIGTILVIIFGV